MLSGPCNRKNLRKWCSSAPELHVVSTSKRFGRTVSVPAKRKESRLVAQCNQGQVVSLQKEHCDPTRLL